MPTPNDNSSTELGFDPEALHRKYLEERDKRLRLRPQGNAQYVDMSGEFAKFADDPYVQPGFTRAPLTDEVDVVVLGGGITGLITAAEFHGAGVSDVRIIEKGGDFGGTWYWNRYPGIRCDVESYIYMPLLEELGYVPTQKYATGGEIFAHCQAIGRFYGLYDKACFQTQVTSIKWDQAILRWVIETDRGDVMKAKFICLGTGPLSKPKLPGIPGIRDFKGHSFHTSRWDYAYTGGDEHGGLTGLADQRVAIIGTGATAIQAIPFLGAWAKELIVFQRTPSGVDLRNNMPTDPEWVRNLRPGWQTQRMMNFYSILNGIPQEQDLIGDRWTDVWHKLDAWSKATAGGPGKDMAELMQLADYQKMEEIRARIDDIVTDKKTSAALKPWYNLWCKRPLFSDDYLQTFNRPNVKLVDTQGRGVTRITANAIEFEGTSYEIDCLIYATGFDVGAPTYEAGSYELVGKDGVTLAAKWGKGVRSLHGIYTHGFPNMFVVGGITQASVTTNVPHHIRDQARHVAAIVKRCVDNQIAAFEVRERAEADWAATMAAKAVDRSKFEQECTPSYFNKEGAMGAGPSLFGGSYGGGPVEYIEICNEWRAKHFEDDLELVKSLE